jgi:hypothetical protein
MDWFKKHADTVLVLTGIIGSVLWMNHKFTQVDDRFAKIDLKFAEIEKDLAVMKAVLIVQGHMPKELAANFTVAP